MIALRKRHPALRRRTFFRGRHRAGCGPDIIWHGVEPGRPDFSPIAGRWPLPWTAPDGTRAGPRFLRGLQRLAGAAAVPHPAVAVGPALAAGGRHGAGVATDIVAPDDGPQVPENSVYPVAPYSLMVLISEA